MLLPLSIVRAPVTAAHSATPGGPDMPQPMICMAALINGIFKIALKADAIALNTFEMKLPMAFCTR